MKKTYTGSCHCGRVRIEADLDLSKGTARCNCSICTKTRTWMAFVGGDAFRLVAGKDELRDYQFGAMKLHHPFCKHCGVRLFGRGQDEAGRDIYAVRLSCLDDAAPEELLGGPVQFFDMRHDSQKPPAETRHL
jgi:hypothetical protein